MTDATAEARQRTLWFLVAVLVLAARIVPPWSQPLGDPDFWWLSWFGSQWLHGAMPTLNAFSWTAPDTPWITHEPGVGVIYALAGPEHLGIIRCLLLAATWLVLAHAAWRPDGARAMPIALLWAMALVAWGVSERALSWGNFMMALTVALTSPARLLTGEPRPIGGGLPNMLRLGFAALVVGVWANLHGSFPVGIMLVALADWRWGVAAAVATLANPHGLALGGLLGRYAPNAEIGSFVATAIPEWQPLALTSASGLGKAALLLMALAAIRPLGWRGVLLWSGFTVMALRHARFTDLAAIGLLPWVSAGLARRLPPLRAPSPVWAAAAITATAAVVLPAPRFASAQFPADFPFGRLAGHRVWNEYQLGGFLGAHGVAVFWDPRVDCYPADILADGAAIEFNDADRLPLLDHWHVDRVVAWSAHILDPLRRDGWTDDGGAGDVHILARPSGAVPSG